MTDSELLRHVNNALDWEPSIDARDIGVTVEDGIVTLRGGVRSYAEKIAAADAALRVYGVKGVANDLTVQLSVGSKRTDTELAKAAADALAWNAIVPPNRVTLSVSDGRITLKGSVDWKYQSLAAERAVRPLTGVTSLTNQIAVRAPVNPGDVHEKIQAALRRSAEVDARRITVTAHDGSVVLGGAVRSWAERQAAEQAAWAAPGVRHVDDRIAIEP
jgi:osmotically-inducible protein OsmY